MLKLWIDCLQCGAVTNDPDISYCENCLDIFEERSTQSQRWAEYHDEPCPEVELTQLPKRA